jgi:glutathione S-transferase
MADLRIFSYLPNPRLFKATIAARLSGVEVEVRGAPGAELRQWLWDFDARPLSEEERRASADFERQGRVGMTGALFKTDAFFAAHPFGTVPAAFSPDGEVGIFESNSIMRMVARLGEKAFPLYGRDPYEASRIDSFLDASLVFARDTQIYLLSLLNDTVTPALHARAAEAFLTYATGIERALSPGRDFLVGDNVTLADICFVAEIALFMNERQRTAVLRRHGLSAIFDDRAATAYPRAMAHVARLAEHRAFAPDLGPYLRKLEASAEEGRP